MTTTSASIEADCNSVGQDAVLALQLATGKNLSLPNGVLIAAVDNWTPSLLDRVAQMPQQSISRFFNISPGYTLLEYVEEDYTMAMYLRNALLVLALLAFTALALKLCCSLGYWHRTARKYNEKVALDYRMQVAQLRAERTSLANEALEK